MARERARASRRGSARHSDTLARGRGDARDHRRENSRLTAGDLDPAALRIVNGRITLAEGILDTIDAVNSVSSQLLELGSGLARDRQGRISVELTETSPITDNTGGAASDTSTLAAIPNPADSPATADALRDDLVANVLPPILDAIATLAAAVNSILAEASTKPRT